MLVRSRLLAALHEELHVAGKDFFAVLVGHRAVDDDEARVLPAREFAGLGHLELGGDGVAGVDRCRDVHVVHPEEGDDAAFEEATAVDEPGGEDERHRSLRDALAEGTVLGVLGVRVQLRPVAGERGVENEVGFGDRAADALEGLALFELLEVLRFVAVGHTASCSATVITVEVTAAVAAGSGPPASAQILNPVRARIWCMDVAVLGASASGRGIAQCCGAAGHAVTLHDDDVNAVMDGVDAVEAGLDDAVDAGRIEDASRDEAVQRIEATTGLDGAVADADLVVEATGADRDERRTLFADIEELVDEDTLIATSGASVSVTAIAAGLKTPGRAVGLHFVDPPAGELVEVVVAEQTTEPTRAAAVSFVDGLDRTPIVVRDTPGFAATRLSLALAVEAMQMIDERVAGVEAVDRAMTAGHDHPVGPLAAVDERGLDDTLDALEHLSDSLGDRFTPPPVLREKVQQGELGRKTGRGFYVWEGGERTDPADPDPTPDLREETPVDPSDDSAPE